MKAAKSHRETTWGTKLTKWLGSLAALQGPDQLAGTQPFRQVPWKVHRQDLLRKQLEERKHFLFLQVGKNRFLQGVLLNSVIVFTL